VPTRLPPVELMEQAEIRTVSLPNGLVLLVEPKPDVQSAALSFMVPAGSIYEPHGRAGTASLLSDLITRGAGDRDSRQLVAAFDALGVQRSETVGWNFISFSAATLADNLAPALELYADLVLRPRLPEDQFSAALAGVEQGLLSIEDEPQRKVLIELRRRCYDAPWGLPTEGELADLPNLTHAGVRDHYRRCFHPNGTILGIAGNVDPDRVRDVVERHFGAWSTGEAPAVERGTRGPAVDHIHQESAQTQIGIAYDAVPYGHDDYYAAWAAVGVLSGGSSARLFTEVRERRGLCYSVYATLNSLLTEGRVLAYAGTTVERAQETLDVMLREMARLADGIGQDELDRCKARAKSSLIMQQESTASRAGSIARDWFHLGRVVTLDEVRDKVNALTVEQVLDYSRRHPPRDLTVLTIGPEPLHMTN
jgi:predicted Zn-dependent peptidase